MKLDLGCGTRKQEGFIGVDSITFPGVDVVSDALDYLKTLEDKSVEYINMSHFLEHFTGPQRVELMNECYRVLKDFGIVLVTCPSWSHERAYGDPTHQWPPVTSWTFFYMNKAWRDVNAPHCGYTCNFDWSVVGTWDQNDPYINFKNNETKSILMTHEINITTDVIATLTKMN
jgi:hypothetical protein